MHNKLTFVTFFFSVVTLIGAHTLGHVHTSASGYGVTPTGPNGTPQLVDNAWDPTPATFDNKYYGSMLNLPVRYMMY